MNCNNSGKKLSSCGTLEKGDRITIKGSLKESRKRDYRIVEVFEEEKGSMQGFSAGSIHKTK